jgi:2-polyprenyl-6-methoxyphenol hydroxylase-like FAD-dependent oxidoreductase
MNISIIGGGITGLTTAIALNKLGIPCKVYESAPELGPVGAGIVMSPNAMKVFKWLGIEDEVTNAGVPLKKAVISNRELKPLRKSKAEFISDPSDQFMIALHRAALQKVLVKNLPSEILQLGHELNSISTNQNGYDLHFKNETVYTDLVLGADGIHSKVREHIFPGSPLRYSGQTCWRGVARFELPAELKEFSNESWGNHSRFGFVNIGEDLIYWFAVISSDAGFKPVQKDVRDFLKIHFNSYHNSVNQMISRTAPEHIIQNDLYDLKRLNSWHKGGICLMGDAAHATTPNMGQGGAQGVEDAYYLSQLLKKYDDPGNAFSAFEQMRRKKVDTIVNNSWMMGKLAHNAIGQPLMKIILKYSSEKQLAKQMQNVFHIDEPMIE